MRPKIIVISGQIACGKSDLSHALHEKFGFPLVRTSELIKERLGKGNPNRKVLQSAGNRLDRETSFSWVADDLALKIRRERIDETIILDGIRKKGQIEQLQRSFGHRHVRHVHLQASFEVRRDRFESRGHSTDGGIGFAEICNNLSEREVLKLKDVADIFVDTDRYTQVGIFNHVSSRLKLVSRTADQLVDVLVGGQLGSEGKGNIADYLSPEYDVLMRVGGPNAGHKVYEEPPYTHTSLPCGSRRSDKAKLLIGPGAVINPEILLKEIRDCEIDVGRLVIDENATLILPEDIKWEMENLKQEIGSTAQGVGAATARRVRDRFRDERGCKLARNLGEVCADLKPYVGSTYEQLESAYSKGKRILLEGTQGTELSLYHGDYPSVTSRDTTVSGCLAEAGIGPRRVRKIVLVCRTFPIRVGGNSGKMERELNWDIVAQRSGNDASALKGREVGSRSGTPRRVSEFDWAQLRKACHLNSPTDIALTFVDHMDIKNSNAVRFEQLTQETINFIEAVEAVSGVPCSLIANKFDFKCVIDRRRW
jgi:adenylosuccinate synthase